MRAYKSERVRDGHKIYYLIRMTEDASIVEYPTRFLLFLSRSKESPNTVRMAAMSMTFYLNYMHEQGLHLEGVLDLAYDKQFLHFSDYLQYLKEGKHTEHMRTPKNATCNAYLACVFRFFRYAKDVGLFSKDLKVLLERVFSYSNHQGRRTNKTYMTFPGYLKSELSSGRTIKRDMIITLLGACTNERDRLLLLLLAETGFRIGEVLGLRYAKDIDLKNSKVRIRYREDNANDARAKNAEERVALVSDVTMAALTAYLSEYHSLLLPQEYLFINIHGENKGEPLHVESVYAMLRELKKKTGITATPHMLRHYFANERRKEGWGIELISKALGHRSIVTTQRYLDIESDELILASHAYYEKTGALIDISNIL